MELLVAEKLTCWAFCWLLGSTFLRNIETFQTFGSDFKPGQNRQRWGNLGPEEAGIRGGRGGGEVSLENSWWDTFSWETV